LVSDQGLSASLRCRKNSAYSVGSRMSSCCWVSGGAAAASRRVLAAA
jgi:hypothetical protein